MDKMLQGQTALVTGAGRGWGRSIALAFARQGAKVAVVARTSMEIEYTLELLHAEEVQAIGLRIDLSEDKAVEEIEQQVLAEFGRLDILVNNAAVLQVKPFEEFGGDEMERTLRINLLAPLAACRLFLEPMRRQGGGSIINVSSNAGVRPFENEAIYCAAKYALEGFTRSLALEVKKYNIAANTITPGGLQAGVRIKPTSLTQAEYDRLNPQEKACWVDSIIMTEAFVFLARQRGNGVTGERVLAFEFSERIRAEGWDLEYRRIDDPAQHWEKQGIA